MGTEPENTLRSFRTGCESNADVVECDVHLSKDGEIMVFHDNTLDRTSNGKGWIREYTVDELQRLDAGQGEKIPTLAEVVDLVSRYRQKLIIEVKAESAATALETTERVAAFVNEHHLASKVIMHSFWHDAVRRFKEICPEIPAAIIMMIGLKPEQMLKLIEDAHADGASIAYDYISPELVALMKDKQYFLDAWVLNDEATFQRMKGMGINGLITNYPGNFKS